VRERVTTEQPHNSLPCLSGGNDSPTSRHSGRGHAFTIDTDVDDLDHAWRVLKHGLMSRLINDDDVGPGKHLDRPYGE
jgi:hypothetical protein